MARNRTLTQKYWYWCSHRCRVFEVFDNRTPQMEAEWWINKKEPWMENSKTDCWCSRSLLCLCWLWCEKQINIRLWSDQPCAELSRLHYPCILISFVQLLFEKDLDWFPPWLNIEPGGEWRFGLCAPVYMIINWQNQDYFRKKKGASQSYSQHHTI